MKKPLLVKLVLLVSLSFGVIQMVSASAESARKEVKCSGHFTYDGSNFAFFTLESESDRDLFASFWGDVPAMNDGKPTEYILLVNGKETTKFICSTPGWQNIIPTGEKIALIKGVNEIALGCKGAEIPAVEQLVLSTEKNNALSNADTYQAYSEKARERENTVNSTTETGGELFEDLPLKYSFFRTYTFEAGTEVNISANSDTPFIIDLFYVGTPTPDPEIDYPIYDPTSVNSQNKLPGLGGDSAVFVPFKWICYTLSSSEMNTVNWLAVSEEAIAIALGGGSQDAYIRAKLPLDGIYMLKLRSQEAGVLGSAMVKVNGTYTYNSVPFFYSGGVYSQPADNEFYESTARGDRYHDDPMLFIEGAGSTPGRIVAFADDHYLHTYGESKDWESYIHRKYFQKTSGFHVSGYSTSQPESTCRVLIGYPYSDLFKSPAKAPKKGEPAGIESDFSPKSISIKENFVKLDGDISITAVSADTEMWVYSLSGLMLSMHKLEEGTHNIQISDLGIKAPGMYLLTLPGKSGKQTFKITVRQ